MATSFQLKGDPQRAQQGSLEPCDYMSSFIFSVDAAHRLQFSIADSCKLDRTSHAAMIDNSNDCDFLDASYQQRRPTRRVADFLIKNRPND